MGDIINNSEWPFDCDKLPTAEAMKNGGEICGQPKNEINKNSEIRETCREKLECPGSLKTVTDSAHYFFGLDDCAPPCKDHFWDKKEIRFSRQWIFGWSVLCLMSTFFTVATYLIDRDRFRYPERPIVFLAGKYMMTHNNYVIIFII